MQHREVTPFSIPGTGKEDYATWLIRHRTSQLLRFHAKHFPEADREDVEQDLKLDLLERWPRFDPAKSTARTFVDRVITHRVAGMLRDRHREQVRQGSLSDCIPLEPDIEDEHSIVYPHQTDTLHQVELEHDVAVVLGRLSGEDRRICELLKEMSVSEAARELGMPVQSLRDRVAGLRAAFNVANLDDAV